MNEQAWYQTNRKEISSVVSALMTGEGASRCAVRAKSPEDAENLIIECAARCVRALDRKCGNEVPDLTFTKQLTPQEMRARMPGVQPVLSA